MCALYQTDVPKTTGRKYLLLELILSEKWKESHKRSMVIWSGSVLYASLCLLIFPELIFLYIQLNYFKTTKADPKP